MIETILTALEKSTPALRQRYLDRIRSVRTDEARAALETALRKGGDESRLALSDLADAVHQARLAIETLLGRG